jgi:hypothetical protein
LRLVRGATREYSPIERFAVSGTETNVENVKDVISPTDDASSPLDDDPFHVNHVNHVPAAVENWEEGDL